MKNSWRPWALGAKQLAGLALVGLVATGQAQTVNSPPDLTLGAKLAAESCAVCHGQQGGGATPDFPRLAGQNERYLVKQLRDFASGVRKSDTMKEKAGVLNEVAIQALAKYYQSQTPVVKTSDDPALAAVGAFIYERGNPYAGLPACLSCHGTAARGNAELPRLAGQHPRYIEVQLKQFSQRLRTNDSSIMGVVASRLTELETKAVAEYLGAMK